MIQRIKKTILTNKCAASSIPSSIMLGTTGQVRNQKNGRHHVTILQWNVRGLNSLTRVPWTRMMTNEQVYELAEARSVPLKHIRSRKLRHFGHIMRQRWEFDDRSCWGKARLQKAENILE